MAAGAALQLQRRGRQVLPTDRKLLAGDHDGLCILAVSRHLHGLQLEQMNTEVRVSNPSVQELDLGPDGGPLPYARSYSSA